MCMSFHNGFSHKINFFFGTHLVLTWYSKKSTAPLPPRPGKIIFFPMCLFLYGFSSQITLWYHGHMGKLFWGVVTSKIKKFLASHIWPKWSKMGGSKYKPCKISTVSAFLVIFWIFPNAVRSFTTLFEVFGSKKRFLALSNLGHDGTRWYSKTSTVFWYF